MQRDLIDRLRDNKAYHLDSRDVRESAAKEIIRLRKKLSRCKQWAEELKHLIEYEKSKS